MGFAESGAGLDELLLVAQGIAEVVVRQSEIGLEGDGLAEETLGLGRLLLMVAQVSTEVVVGHGEIGLELDGLAEGIGRLVKLLLVSQGSAEIVVRVGKIGLELDGPAAGSD